MSTRLIVASFLAVSALNINPALAQENPSGAMPLTRVVKEAAKDFVGLASLDTAIVLGIGGAGALAVHPADRNVNWQLGGADYEFLDSGRFIGQGAMQGALAAATYVVGRAGADSRTARIGQELIRAQLVTGGATFAIKVATQRPRPDGSNNLSFPPGTHPRSSRPQRFSGATSDGESPSLPTWPPPMSPHRGFTRIAITSATWSSALLLALRQVG
jgi:hypothetical protein